LSDLEKREREHREGRQRVMEGKGVFRDLAKEYQERLDGMPNLKPRTRQYYNERLEAMLKSWPGLNAVDVRKLTEDDCRQWANRLKMVQEIRRVPFGPGLASAELVECLAYTGLRVKSEAAHAFVPPAAPVQPHRPLLHVGWAWFLMLLPDLVVYSVCITKRMTLRYKNNKYA
jgi:hypothetical protein